MNVKQLRLADGESINVVESPGIPPDGIMIFGTADAWMIDTGSSISRIVAVGLPGSIRCRYCKRLNPELSAECAGCGAPL